MELRGKLAVVTGVSGRLGAAFATALAQAGCKCICHYCKNREPAESLAKKLCESGTKATAVQADLTQSEQIEKLFKRASELGTPQILINSAAVFTRDPLAEVTVEKTREVLDINLTASILTSKVFARLIEAEFGRTEKVVGKIVNISGLGGIKPWAKGTVYCASKAGLIGATKALAKELAPATCVNSVAPGMVTWPESFTEERKKRLLALIPAARIATIEEVTKAVLFLLDNDYITGQVLAVDGGKSM